MHGEAAGGAVRVSSCGLARRGGAAVDRARETIAGWLPGFLRPEASIAPDGFNRWMALPPVVAVQLSVGSLYAWSIFNGPLQRELGVIA